MEGGHGVGDDSVGSQPLVTWVVLGVVGPVRAVFVLANLQNYVLSSPAGIGAIGGGRASRAIGRGRLTSNRNRQEPAGTSKKAAGTGRNQHKTKKI